MKNTKRNKINLIFSSFLVIGYIVCAYFFSTLANQVSGTLGSVIQVAMLVLFGLLLFYATRVGEGVQVKRFSLAVLLLVDLPCIYIILASYIAALPFHDALASVSTVMSAETTVNSQSIVMMLACIALGYGIPYTFLSGYELKTYDEIAAEAEESPEEILVEGGLAEELAQIEDEAEDAAEDIVAEAEEKAAEEAVDKILEEEE